MRIREIFILKMDSFILAFTSILFGATIFLNPGILDIYKIYSLIRSMFDNKLIGLAFIVLGAMKIIGIFTNSVRMRKIAIRGLLFLWLLFFIAFLISPPPNIIWVFALSEVILAIGASIKEGVE